MSLLPQGPLTRPGMSVAALCAPAREVGGDYYDFLPLPDGRVGLLIADVSGKGTSAALYMAELKGLMLSLSRIHTSPRALLIEANRIISRHLDSRSFITMTYAVDRSRAGTLTCARAGHTPFIRIPAARRRAAERDVLAPDGMVLGSEPRRRRAVRAMPRGADDSARTRAICSSSSPTASARRWIDGWRLLRRDAAQRRSSRRTPI